MRLRICRFAFIALAVFLLAACSVPASIPGAQATGMIQTISALQTTAATLQTLPPTLTPVPSATATIAIATPDSGSATPAGITVLNTTLCWLGPGRAYKVISSLKPGTTLVPIAIGSIPGWLIINNPIYNDLCWVQTKDLQIPPGFDTSGLKIYNPPPTPGPRPTERPTAAP